MTTCSDFINPLNLECLLVNTFAGDHQIFLFLSYIVIASMAAFFRMNAYLLFIFLFIYTIFIGTVIETGFMILLLWVGIGIFVFWALSKPYKV